MTLSHLPVLLTIISFTVPESKTFRHYRPHKVPFTDRQLQDESYLRPSAAQQLLRRFAGDKLTENAYSRPYAAQQVRDDPSTRTGPLLSDWFRKNAYSRGFDARQVLHPQSLRPFAAHQFMGTAHSRPFTGRHLADYEYSRPTTARQMLNIKFDLEYKRLFFPLDGEGPPRNQGKAPITVRADSVDDKPITHEMRLIRLVSQNALRNLSHYVVFPLVFVEFLRVSAAQSFQASRLAERATFYAVD